MSAFQGVIKTHQKEFTTSKEGMTTSKEVTRNLDPAPCYTEIIITNKNYNVRSETKSVSEPNRTS